MNIDDFIEMAKGKYDAVIRAPYHTCRTLASHCPKHLIPADEFQKISNRALRSTDTREEGQKNFGELIRERLESETQE
ncbi:hypothetical protein H6775_02865 [Candidatus Nomurabacteria bacterium]|nr:hypothetical protein [Candidatus Nomurabacteria bacterium]